METNSSLCFHQICAVRPSAQFSVSSPAPWMYPPSPSSVPVTLRELVQQTTGWKSSENARSRASSWVIQNGRSGFFSWALRGARSILSERKDSTKSGSRAEI